MPMTIDEQMARRQSLPRPMDPIAVPESPYVKNGFDVLDEVIKKEDILKAQEILKRYKQGKANLENRIVENEQWYKLRHWGQLGDKKNEVEPTSAWLFNAIANKHADAMDNFPAPTVLPREEGDQAEAKMLTSVIPVILDQNDFEQTYSDVWHYKLKTGTGVYGVLWDPEKLNGLGDISVVKADILNLFWQPGVTDIQKSRHFFSVTLIDNEALEEQYPQLKDKLSTPTVDVAKYIYDDSVDTTEKSVVVDWYYKKKSGTKTVLHYCKFCNDVILFASENDPNMRERGFYDHGLYPFIFDPLYPVEGTPAGFGYVDVGKNPQMYIDRLGKSILENALANARPRHFIRTNGGVNEAEFSDITRDFVHVDGNLGEDSIRPIDGKQLPSIYYEVLQGKIDELKETMGNRDVSTGGSTHGVTAASAIAAMQEAGGKLSRDNSKASYRAYRRMILMIIELIRQFYDMPRTFRILGANGAQQYVEFSNSGMQAQPLEQTFGMGDMYRLPLYDVEVSAQRSSPYSKLSQNEMALNFYSAGMFNPQMDVQALACLEMMDFDRKETIMQRIAQNGETNRLLQQLMMMTGMIPGAEPAPGQESGAKAAPAAGTDNNDGFGGMTSESPVTKKARQQAAERTMPQ